MELRSKKKNKKFCYVQILNIAKSKKWLVIGLVLLSGLAYAGWESWTQLTAPADGDILAVQDISDTTQDATGTAKYLTLTTFWTEYLKGKADALYQPIFQSQTANYAFIAPNGSAGVPTFRALVVADISDLLSGNHTFAGNLTFNGTTTIGVPVWPDTATLPDEVGQLRYVNNALSFTDGAFGWYDDDEVRYLIDTAMVDDTAGGTNALTNRPPSSNALYDVAQAKLNIADIDDTPVNSETAAPISSNWAYDHAALTAAHGVSGAVVGTTDTQALTNKDISSDTNTFPAIPPDMTMPLIACYNPQDVYDKIGRASCRERV